MQVRCVNGGGLAEYSGCKKKTADGCDRVGAENSRAACAKKCE